MSIKMTNSEVGGVSVVELDGRIVLGEESNSLREKLKSLVAAGKKNIVLNMANVTYIDSMGLGTLVAAHVSAKTQGASVRLCHLGQKISRCIASDQAADCFRRLRYPSGRGQQLPGREGHRRLRRSQIPTHLATPLLLLKVEGPRHHHKLPIIRAWYA